MVERMYAITILKENSRKTKVYKTPTHRRVFPSSHTNPFFFCFLRSKRGDLKIDYTRSGRNNKNWLFDNIIH